LFIFRF
jgi:death-associated protein 6